MDGLNKQGKKQPKLKIKKELETGITKDDKLAGAGIDLHTGETPTSKVKHNLTKPNELISPFSQIGKVPDLKVNPLD